MDKRLSFESSLPARLAFTNLRNALAGGRVWGCGALSAGGGWVWRVWPGEPLPWRKVKQNNRPVLPARHSCKSYPVPNNILGDPEGNPGVPGRAGDSRNFRGRPRRVLSPKLGARGAGVGGGVLGEAGVRKRKPDAGLGYLQL